MKFKTQTAGSLSTMTAQKALNILKEGNQRFIDASPIERDYAIQIELTKSGQYPFAVVLSCIDSRVPSEIVFDQGIGDIFNARVAGNCVSDDVLGSIEYATKFAGSKLIVVMGHTACGAINSACAGIESGHITQLLEKIHPAIQKVKNKKNETEESFIYSVTIQNVKHVLQEIPKQSEDIRELLASKQIEMIGSIYDVESGKVEFFNAFES
tara:strand:+ start:472 stop:1104 length:633 start_codon:yes stop_codon:yes gene_type:complete